MNKRSVAMCFLLFATGLPLSLRADDLALLVETDREIYEFAKPIRVTVTILNNNKWSYRLAATAFERPGQELFRIKSPQGRAVSTLREYGRNAIDERPKIIRIEPGGSYVVTFNLMDHYPDTYPTGNPHNFDDPGTYEVVAYYSVSERQAEMHEGIHAGPFQSDPVKFVVKPLKGVRLEELLEQLSADDPASKAKTLSLLRRGRATERIPDLVGLMRANNPDEVRREAAHAIYDAPDPSAWEVYADFLDDPHPAVRGFVALALGRIGNRAAGDALYDVTDPKRYPRSYASAFKAMIQIGDSRAREVAARLEKSAPSPAIREMARKFLRDNQP